MKRTFAIAAFVVFCAPTPAQAPRIEKIDGIQLLVGPNKEIYAKVPNISKNDLAEILSTFLSKGNNDAKKKIDSLLTESPNVTIVLTSQR